MEISIETKNINLLNYKSKLIVLILGSYDHESLLKLRDLRDYLISKGWSKCRLVEDLNDPKKRNNETNEEYIVRKSIFWIERSDICIFVLNCNVNNEGVGQELKHMCDHLESKIETSIIMIDKNCKRYASSMIIGLIDKLYKLRTLNRRYFKNQNKLNIISNNSIIGYLYILAPILIIRNSLTK